MAIVLTPLPFAAAVVTTNTAPAIGKTTYYNASGGSLNVPLLALSGLNTGARFCVRRDPADKSSNTITFTCAGSDTFYSSGGTTFTLPIFGEQRDYQVVNDGSGKHWGPAGPINPVAGNDTRYLVPAARQPVAITNNCYAMSPTVVTTNTTTGTWRFIHTVGVACTDIKLVFGNYFLPAAVPKVDNDPSTSVTFKASVEDTSGNIYPVTFKGALSYTLNGGGIIESDLMPIVYAPGDVLAVRVDVTSGTFYANRWATGGTTTGITAWGDGYTSATDLTAKGAAAPANAFSLGFGPMAIIGNPTSVTAIPKALLAQGDSILSGLSDGQNVCDGYWAGQTWWAGGGYIMRIMDGQGGVTMIAQASDRIQDFLSNVNSFRRNSFTKYAKFALIEYGINDLNNSRTPAQLQADIITLATRNLGRGIVKNFIVTLAPNTTSTDNWATTGNQTPNATSNTNRVTHNTWVRDQAPLDYTSMAPVATGTTGSTIVRMGDPRHPISAYLEIADTVESARNSGLWKAANRVVTDAAITSGNNIVTSATAAWTSADVTGGHGVAIVGAGAAGAMLNAHLKQITPTIALTTTAGTTVSGATMVIRPLTFDGIHPTGTGHQLIASGVGTALLALMT